MAKKKFYAILDTESTIQDTAADFAIVICDRSGEIHDQIAVLVEGHYAVHELFHDENAGEHWNKASLARRNAEYCAMLNNGRRMICSATGVNRWIGHAISKFDPELTAFNLTFDARICRNTGIDLSGFSSRFCLWRAAVGNICKSRKYLQFVLENHLFNDRTPSGNMSYITNAEAICNYLTGLHGEEPHTALEDARDWERPILQAIVAKRGWRDRIVPYSWQSHQLRDHFKVA